MRSPAEACVCITAAYQLTAVSGMVAGLVSSVRFVLISLNLLLGEAAIFRFINPALVSISIGFLASYLGTILSSEKWEGRILYEEIYVRFNPGPRRRK